MAVNPAAVLASAAACFATSLLWFRFFHLKAWQAQMGLPSTDVAVMPVRGIHLVRPAVIMAAASLLTAFVLAQGLALIERGMQQESRHAVPSLAVPILALAVWAGFLVPQLLASVAWEHRSWRLFWAQAVYHLLALQLMAWILALWPRT